MKTQTVRIYEADHMALADLARMADKSMTATLSDAITAYQRQQLLQQTSDAYAALRNDPDAWAEEVEERRLWDNTLSDGLQNS